jgi:hypothetical protein
MSVEIETPCSPQDGSVEYLGFQFMKGNPFVVKKLKA